MPDRPLMLMRAGHVLCRGCLASLDPRACPYCRQAFRWEDVHKLQCEFRAAPGVGPARAAPAEPSAKQQRAEKLARRIQNALASESNASDNTYVAQCDRLVGKVLEFLLACGENEVRVPYCGINPA